MNKLIKILLIVIGILLIFIGILCYYIYSIKKELQSICYFIKEDGMIRSIQIDNREIEELCTCMNNKIEQLQSQEKILKKQNYNFKKLVANLSHDIRTPITIIIGYLQLIKMENNLSDTVKHYVDCTEKKSNYLKKLIDDLYLLFWSECLDDELEMKSLDCIKVIRYILKEYISNFQKMGEMLQIDIPDESIHIMADEKVFIRILSNLLDNALKYSLDTIYFWVKCEDNFCKIYIKNRTNELKVERIETLFELYSTGGNISLSSGGMGLYITKKLVEQLGGMISVQYQEKNFEVSISFPLSQK